MAPRHDAARHDPTAGPVDTARTRSPRDDTARPDSDGRHAGPPVHPRAAATGGPPTDPDVDLHVPAQRREFGEHPAVLLASIGAGGAIGALARYGLSAALPHPAGAFAWSTFAVNVTGCFVIGVLMVVITELSTPHRLVRPFLGVGVLGGYTTFSTSIVDFQRMVGAGHARVGLAYLVGTVLAALVAVYLGTAVGRAAARRWAVRR